ncbi:hypothetical protein CBS147346_9358 [Aspergillus niger]|nr:hypothetical protein CBS147346_9358 [Aspergillus niger]
MPPPPPSKPHPLTPTPTNYLTFDTWNSSSTGHQVADPGSSRGITSWRETRREKLTRQFGVGRGDCTYDSDNGVIDKGEWVLTQEESISAEMQKKSMEGRKQQQRDIRKKKRIRIDHDNENKSTDTDTDTESRNKNNISTSTIFSSLTIHINGQTTPTVSDHKLKHLLISHGANLSLHMHRGVTHVILGEPNAHSSSSSSSLKPGVKVAGAGGGLAAGKLQKEIQRGGWKGVKLVRVQWAVDSIAAGKRLSEAKYAVQLRTNQRSVLAFTSSTSTATSNTISSLS